MNTIESEFPPNRLQCRPPFREALKHPLVAFGFLGLSAVLLLLGVVGFQSAVRAKAFRKPNDTMRKFGQIALGLNAYSDWEALQEFERSHSRDADGGLSLAGVPWGTGRLPSPAMSRIKKSGGSFSCSWRYALFPILIGVGKLLDPQEPWDAPINQAVVNEYGSFFCSGAEAAPDAPIRNATALAITGPGTAFGDGKEPPMPLNEVPPAAILVVEVRESGIPWPAPGDFDVRTMPHSINSSDGRGISGQRIGGFHVIFGDRKVWFLSDKVPFETLQKFFTVADAKKYDRETLLGPFALNRPPGNAGGQPSQ